MSTKRGRRNGVWHKEKSNRRLQQKRDELRQQSHEITYEPLEKPIFAGWDIKIGLTESGTRRRDSQEVQKVLNILNLSREMFTREIKFIKHIRNNNHSIDSIKSFYQHRGYYVDHFSNRHITYNEYHNLPEHLKRWFYEDRCYKYSNWWRNDGKSYYGVTSSFPWYECRVIVTKSFYNYKKVYNTVAQSEYAKLDGDLYVIDRKMWGRDKWRDSFVRANKVAYRNATKSIVSNQYTPDEVIDNYSTIFRHVNNNRNYGWS